MIKTDVQKSVFRILSDTIKSDNIITVDELDRLEEACDKFSISDQAKEDSYAITLGMAVETLSRQGERIRKNVMQAMQEIALKDGECSRAESLIIMAIEMACENNGAKVMSFESGDRPLLTAQLLYIEDQPAKTTLLDTAFAELSGIVRMCGMELTYIPQVARHFREYEDGRHGDLKRVLKLVSPLSSESDLDNSIAAIEGMTTRYFYTNVLCGKLGMNMEIDRPNWILRLPDSVVSGTGYANFLCIPVENDIRLQLLDLIARLNSRLSSYSITVNDGRSKEQSFLYSGFYKVLLDTMTIRKIDKWNIHIRLYGDSVEQFRYSDGQRIRKCVMTIRKGFEEYPIPLSGRDVAFYLLILCASASNEKGVDFHDESMRKLTEKRYAELYRHVSRRDTDLPQVWFPESRIPMRSRVAKAINESVIARQSSLQDIYLPKETRRGLLSVQLEPGRVFIDSGPGSKPLAESDLFRSFCASSHHG